MYARVLGSGTLCTDPAIAVNLMAHQSIGLKVVNVLKLSLYSRWHKSVKNGGGGGGGNIHLYLCSALPYFNFFRNQLLLSYVRTNV